jgi:3-phenylpropionate/cinnamic acid dioxygenase small subunit
MTTTSVGEDIALIQNLTGHYALAIDENRWEDWLQFWVDEERCFENPAGQFIGKEGFDRLLPILQSRTAGKRHFVTNSAISVNGAHATQTCYTLIMPKSGPANVVGTAVYRDDLVKIDGTWRFKKRKIEFDPVTPV